MLFLLLQLFIINHVTFCKVFVFTKKKNIYFIFSNKIKYIYVLRNVFLYIIALHLCTHKIIEFRMNIKFVYNVFKNILETLFLCKYTKNYNFFLENRIIYTIYIYV